MITQPRSILRIKQVHERTGLKTTAIYQLIAEGSFPKSHRIANTKAVGWDSQAVDAWVAAQLDGSEAKRSA